MSSTADSTTASPTPLLGDVAYPRQTFDGLDDMFADFARPSFARLNARQRYERICRSLLELINRAPAECFLLPAFASFLERVTEANLLASSINQTGFEMWLNLISNLSEEENARVRARIAGKHIPREGYQPLFPIGMGNYYPGSHFVTAHNPPDLDTTTASFWGWLDSFACRVGENLHIWNLPGGVPSRQTAMLFDEMLGRGIFTRIAKPQRVLTMAGRDLVTRKNLIRKKGDDTIDSVDHERYENAVILVDEQGFYQGDWRSTDVEGVRQVMQLLNECLMSFENYVMLSLISLFSKEDLARTDLEAYVQNVFQQRIADFAQIRGYSADQLADLQSYMTEVLDIEAGTSATIEQFGEQMDRLASSSFAHFRSTIERLVEPELYEGSGYIREDRSKIFSLLQDIYVDLDRAIDIAESYSERLDVALGIKRHVLGFPPNYVTTRTDVDEIRARMGAYSYLTVAYLDTRRNLIPVGIIRSVDLRRGTLGTVSLRDFGNLEEIGIANYLQVISVVDHHKTSIQTTSPPLAVIGDAQSTCVLLAELAFQINDRFSTGGMTGEEIHNQIVALQNRTDLSHSDIRVLQRLYSRQMADRTRGAHYIHPDREFSEYLSFLNAILDDTDLLTKVTRRDVVCTAALLNRLKSLMLRREVEIIEFDDIAQDEHFPTNAAKRLLRNDDLFSFYRKIFQFREQELEHKLRDAVKEDAADLFEDTKRQNGCCSVGQIKIFKTNYPTFAKHRDSLRTAWLDRCKGIYADSHDIDLHIQMISTIAGADEAYAGNIEHYEHQDELWLWTPGSETAHEHMQSFVLSFGSAAGIRETVQAIELIGKHSKEAVSTWQYAFPRAEIQKGHLPDEPPQVALRLSAGRLNSRKAFISPYLPKPGN